MFDAKKIASILALSFLVGGCENNESQQRKGVIKGIEFEVKSFGSVDALFSFEKTENAHEAVHSGELRVVEGCLFVSDSLVVWPKGSESKIEELVEKLAKSEKQRISLQGSGTGNGEGEVNISKAKIPCEFDTVWFVAEFLTEQVE